MSRRSDDDEDPRSPSAEDSLWRTQDGRAILVKDLTDDHLFFIINMLEGKGAAAAWAVRERDADKPVDDDYIVNMMESKLARLPASTVRKYGKLILEREKRIMAGKWRPGPVTVPKPRGLPPRPRT